MRYNETCFFLALLAQHYFLFSFFGGGIVSQFFNVGLRASHVASHATRKPFSLVGATMSTHARVVFLQRCAYIQTWVGKFVDWRSWSLSGVRYRVLCVR